MGVYNDKTVIKINDYLIKNQELMSSMGFEDIIIDDINLLVNNPTEELGEEEESKTMVLLPFKDNITGDYHIRSSIHYANRHLENFLDDEFIKTMRKSLVNVDRVSKPAMKTITKMMNVMNSEKSLIEMDISYAKKKSSKLSNNSYLFKDMKVIIKLDVYKRKLFLSPNLLFAKSSLKTINDKLTAYSFIKAFEELNPEVEVKFNDYATYKTSLLMTNNIKNFFKSIYHGEKDIDILDTEDLSVQFDEYIESYKRVKSLVNSNLNFDKKLFMLDYNISISYITNPKYESFRNNYEMDMSEDFVSDNSKSKLEEIKQTKEEKVIIYNKPSEEDFKKDVKEMLTKHKYERVYVHNGDPTLSMWIREATMELRREMVNLGVEPHPSILLTLGEKIIEEYINNNNTTNASAVNTSSMGIVPTDNITANGILLGQLNGSMNNDMGNGMGVMGNGVVNNMSVVYD